MMAGVKDLRQMLSNIVALPSLFHALEATETNNISINVRLCQSQSSHQDLGLSSTYSDKGGRLSGIGMCFMNMM